MKIARIAAQVFISNSQDTSKTFYSRSQAFVNLASKLIRFSPRPDSIIATSSRSVTDGGISDDSC
jgi:hypothetical protein